MPGVGAKQPGSYQHLQNLPENLVGEIKVLSPSTIALDRTRKTHHSGPPGIGTEL